MAGDPTDRLVSDETREAEASEVGTGPKPDRMPTDAEAEAAERGAEQAPDVSESYKEQAERGANHPGEGRTP
jgi:hypothetical protein